MKRNVIAAVWVVGATVPLLLATVFIVGCCVLPFHQVAHKLMPICDFAASILRGDHGRASHDHAATPPAPAREKQEGVKRIVTEVPGVFRMATSAGAVRLLTAAPASAYRSFISLGAVRCDRDVGLHVLVQTFLI